MSGRCLLMDDGIDSKSIVLAAKNIADHVGLPPSRAAFVIYSPPKEVLASAIAAELENRGIACSMLRLGSFSGPGPAPLRDMVRSLAGDTGLVFLTTWAHSELLFETIGRPDRGIKVPSHHLYADFCVGMAAFVRTHAVDASELKTFRENLLALLSSARRIRVTAPGGTDITLVPRAWNWTNGEVFTAPLEGTARGTIVVDGCAYSGPPKKPFRLVVEDGRVVNLAELDKDYDQQAMVLTDLTRDDNAAVLAEFGIGINPGALPNADLMEAEQARGTCHFGFGHNLEYGGNNSSVYHFDLVVRNPIIQVERQDGQSLRVDLSDG